MSGGPQSMMLVWPKGYMDRCCPDGTTSLRTQWYIQFIFIHGLIKEFSIKGFIEPSFFLFFEKILWVCFTHCIVYRTLQPKMEQVIQVWPPESVPLVISKCPSLTLAVCTPTGKIPQQYSLLPVHEQNTKPLIYHICIY